ncbi:cytochrome B [Synechococcus sp. CB0101]|uniref:cytochrome b/b6 domain-containing protein n=1 Tax=Synechococcus sp. CB0101 TaxID=232348 RepID=UPI0002002864|nr:cytochrome b/b6 domain-containing protein [Synechococcus sp. CB0101]QCH13645.1 cytochrome B [Synechococcus sp. CB0101]
MNRPIPYQPSLLRLLHGCTALLVPLAWLSGLVVFSNHDGRWLRLPTLPGDWIDIHGTVGVLLWPVALVFALYALNAGRSRLRQPANAAALIGLMLAIGSGKLMQEDWLRTGQLDAFPYHLHLLAWLLISGAVIWHGGAVLRRGGWRFARSMAQLQVRENDGPRSWPRQLLRRR